jgi:hypothetical protein
LAKENEIDPPAGDKEMDFGGTLFARLATGNKVYLLTNRQGLATEK